MAHKKSILNKFLTDPEDTGDSQGDRSPIFQRDGWVVPETSHSDQDKFANPQQNDNTTSKYVYFIYVFKMNPFTFLSQNRKI